ncbi:hypothetical protein X943_000238 [Babesia divergens]|uniref:TOG domain-containing protein n=1 Tax=Babesia divergens TaxID=32595 RepID=A0AAD9GJ23_BABDI|nr:hypothetical protein X943_000238 [Babesia divergens]
MQSGNMWDAAEPGDSPIQDSLGKHTYMANKTLERHVAPNRYDDHSHMPGKPGRATVPKINLASTKVTTYPRSHDSGTARDMDKSTAPETFNMGGRAKTTYDTEVIDDVGMANVSRHPRLKANDRTRKVKPYIREKYQEDGDNFSNNNNELGGENPAADNNWDLDGDEHVEITREYGYANPVLTGIIDNTVDDEAQSSLSAVAKSKTSPSLTYAPNYNDNIAEQRYTPKHTERNETGPRTTRPQPLKRGARPIPMRSRVEPLKPTAMSVTKLMEKLIYLGEAKWSEQIKCQNELSNIAGKYPELLKECDSAVLVEALRAVTMQANSGRSNVSKGGITCLGNLYNACGLMLNSGLGDVVDVCTRKAASGSPDFICTAANTTLAKICASASEVKLASILLQKHKANKSAQGVILNCLIILLNRMGPDMEKLKTLPDILTTAVEALTAGSLALRAAGKIILGQINEQQDVIQLLNKMRKGDDVARTASTALKKYKVEEKVKYLESLTANAI